MKNYKRYLLLFLFSVATIQGAIDESNPWPIPPPPTFPVAPRSSERTALSPLVLATSVGVIAILVVLALTSFNNHSHAAPNNGNS